MSSFLFFVFLCFFFFFFFFSSRRRHTRWPRDWSSDVCSSDLSRQAGGAFQHPSSVRVLAHDRVAGRYEIAAPSFQIEYSPAMIRLRDAVCPACTKIVSVTYWPFKVPLYSQHSVPGTSRDCELA